MSVLLSGHGADRAALDAARRLAGYRRLVLLAPDPRAPDVRRLVENERLANVRVDVVRVDPGDFWSCYRAADRALAEHGRAARVHVAGGANLLASALLLAAFHHGVDAFYCHARGVTSLPVALDVRLEDRFTPAEREVLRRLPRDGEAAVDALADAALAPAAAKGALLRLRAKGLVVADARRAALTATGRACRAALDVR